MTSRLRKSLEDARAEHRAARYPGDLAEDVLDRAEAAAAGGDLAIARPAWAGRLALAASIAVAAAGIAVAAVVVWRGTRPTPVAIRPSEPAADESRVEAAPPQDFSLPAVTLLVEEVPGLPDLAGEVLLPPGLPDWPALSTAVDDEGDEEGI